MRAVGPPHPSRGRVLLHSAVLTRRACPLGGAEVELLEGGAMPRRTKFGLLPRKQKGYDKAPLVSGAERL